MDGPPRRSSHVREVIRQRKPRFQYLARRGERVLLPDLSDWQQISGRARSAHVSDSEISLELGRFPVPDASDPFPEDVQAVFKVN